AATAAALAVHRFLEGAAVALAGSAAVALALAAHAFGEGLATGTLLGGRPRPQVAGWLALMCLSPVIGAAPTDTLPVPAAAPARRGRPARGPPGPAPRPLPALPARRDHHHGRYSHRAGRARGRLSFVRAADRLTARGPRLSDSRLTSLAGGR